ncbi:aspartate kinase [Pseudoalteromonas sp. CO325X]|uniref:aspartate kinase n=1 Tax=Pseudoalteromonas sp. CO325X TaxID=1777262 RepID=UPI001022E99E|nr:aspartate kinase [Pseudoalteromonas sp. CO325X]RZF77209.1 aspartate kinase [Pseudoalteromonas sp. CO325X]
MALLVQKFGGTSVGSIERIEAVADIIIRQRQQGHHIVAVVSAMSGETNRLLALAEQVDSSPSPRELDALVSTGEQVSASLLAMALIRRGYPAISLLGDQLGIRTDNLFTKARINDINSARLRQEIEHGRIVIAAGFQGRDLEGNITTLGRGGSDTSAVAIAAAINAQECQIYTDVDGVYTTDPRIEPGAWKLSSVSVQVMLEMASLGAKVLHIRAVEAAAHYKMPLRVLSSFNVGEGTRVDYEDEGMQQQTVSGIASKREQALIFINDCSNDGSTLANIVELLAEKGIEIDMINQVNQKVGKVDYAISVPSLELQQAMSLLQESGALSGAKIDSRDDLAMLSIVGAGIKTNTPITGRFFRVLADENIDVVVASSGEIKLSVLIERKYLELGVRALHAAFLTASE